MFTRHKSLGVRAIDKGRYLLDAYHSCLDIWEINPLSTWLMFIHVKCRSRLLHGISHSNIVKLHDLQAKIKRCGKRYWSELQLNQNAKIYFTTGFHIPELSQPHSETYIDYKRIAKLPGNTILLMFYCLHPPLLSANVDSPVPNGEGFKFNNFAKQLLFVSFYPLPQERILQKV